MSLQKSNTKGTSKELTEPRNNTRVTSFDSPEKLINSLHNDIRETFIDAGKVFVNKSIQIGELLYSKKAELEYGKFQEWVNSNLDFSYMHATRYMKIFIHRKAILEQDGIDSIRMALQFIKAGELDKLPPTTNSHNELIKKLRLALKEKDNSILNKSERKILMSEFEKKEERLKIALAEIKKRKSFLE
jgi:hypothetical protein